MHGMDGWMDAWVDQLRGKQQGGVVMQAQALQAVHAQSPWHDPSSHAAAHQVQPPWHLCPGQLVPRTAAC